ncbi:MAG: heavy metal translocating P-type ATPase [Burkholderiales bacterium]|nr:heavy metal translocating P-type ATPase [Burkholderiales bacterium]
MKFKVVSHTKGRIRFTSDFPFGHAAAMELTDKLDMVPGVESVSINARTRSVLLQYSSNASLEKAKRVLAKEMRELSQKSLEIPVGQSVLSDIAFWPTLRYTLRPILPLPLRIGFFTNASKGIFAEGFKKLFSGKLTVEVLDLSAMVISLILGDFRTAATLALLLGFGEKLESWTRKKTMEGLTRSLALNIDTVWTVRGDQEVETPISAITMDDIIVVRTGSAIPVDGTVIKGDASVNQATMTGEPIGVLRTVGNTVFAGTVVEDGELYIRPSKIGGETRLNKIIDYIENSEKVKATVELQADQLANKVVPFSFLLAGIVWLLTRNLARVAAVLMVDYSCALKMATPVAFFSAMKEGANRKMLVKGGRYLEALSEVDTVVFDKTGTLTMAHPRVTEVVPLADWNKNTILKYAACLEEHFPHPVAHAVVKAAFEKGLLHEEEHTEVKYIAGHGICSMLNNEELLIGSRHYLEEDEGIDCSFAQPEIDRIASQGHTVLYLSRGKKLIGLLGIEDPLREESADVIKQLRELGIKNICMITGDGPRTAANVAGRLGITEFYDQVLPTGKAEIIQRMTAEGRKVMMIGDGINDSPALSAASVGVTVTGGADLAREVADVVLLESDLGHLPDVIRLGRETMGRIHQNFRSSVGLNTAFLAGGLIGVLPAAVGAVLHNATTVGITLNAARSKLGHTAFIEDIQVIDDFVRQQDLEEEEAIYNV